jgi:hypothetical protein
VRRKEGEGRREGRKGRAEEKQGGREGKRKRKTDEQQFVLKKSY